VRAAQYLVLGAKARALTHGRYHVAFEDVRALAHPVMRHRVLTNFHAESEGVTTDQIIDKLLAAVPVPEVGDVAMERRNATVSMRGAQFVDPSALARIRNLELLARTVVDGFINGLHRAPHLGFSLDFAEHRGYEPGDDLRRVDWRVFARTDRYYVKQFEADSNANLVVALDISPSMRYGSRASPSWTTGVSWPRRCCTSRTSSATAWGWSPSTERGPRIRAAVRPAPRLRPLRARIASRRAGPARWPPRCSG